MTEQMTVVGNVRRITARWSITATLRATSPVHLGSGEHGDAIDLLLLRDRVSGAPLLTGASLAGGLRDYVCDEILGPERPEEVVRTEGSDRAPGAHGPKDRDESMIATVFGGAREDPHGEQSALIAFDAIGQAVPEVRDGLRINPAEGVADEHFKFSYELWPAGTSFPIRLDLLIGDAATEPQMVAVLAAALGGVNQGCIRVGAKGHRGFGRCELVGVHAVRFDLATAQGWLTWLASEGVERQVLAGETRPTALEAMCATWPDHAADVSSRTDRLQRDSQTQRFTVRVPIAFQGGVQIGTPQTQAVGADIRQLESAGRPVLSGTALAGPLRNRARRITHLVHPDNARATELVEHLLGSEPTPQNGDRLLHASRLLVEEVPVQGGGPLQTTRIQLDAFTQAPVSGMLVQEEPWFGGRAELVFTLRLPAEPALGNALRGLLLLLVKDLLLGDVPVGGTTGIGRGAIKPAGALSVNVDGGAVRNIDLDRPPADDVRAEIEKWIQAFHTFRGAA